MKIEIELTDAQVEALDAFLSTQLDQIPNPISGNVSMRPKYPTIQDFALSHFGIVVGNAMQMFPPAAVEADVRLIKDAQDRIAGLSKPTLAAVVAEPVKN